MISQAEFFEFIKEIILKVDPLLTERYYDNAFQVFRNFDSMDLVLLIAHIEKTLDMHLNYEVLLKKTASIDEFCNVLYALVYPNTVPLMQAHSQKTK